MSVDLVSCNWTENMAFEAEVDGFKMTLDADPSVGGEGLGPKPKPLMLAALAGCTAMDVRSLLYKMRQEVTQFTVKIAGSLSESHPKVYAKKHLIYEVEGVNLNPAKIEKAVSLSLDRYCGVHAMLRQVSDITYEIRLAEAKNVKEDLASVPS